MCGIAGAIGQIEREQLNKMVTAIHHRGPDDDGFLVDEQNNAFLGMRRLAIIDVAHGQQPVYNSDRSLGVVYNGEIYNYKQLRRELEARGCKFATQSDTEVIVYAYQEYGTEAFRRLNGMFALALWDKKNKRLLIARDRLGQKPLFYTTINNKFYFASELKCFESVPGFKKQINQSAFIKFIDQTYIGGEDTIYEGVYKLPPGSLLTYENNLLHIQPYWSLPDLLPDEKADFTSMLEQLDKLIEDAVRIRLMSEVPLGVFLSGGLDSSLITYYAQQNSSQKIKTYTVKFSQASFDESDQAALVARHLGTEHTQEEVGLQEMLSVMDSLPEIMDEPQADTSYVPTYWLSRLTKKHVTVALGGDAGDELFYGYQTFKAWRQWHLLKQQPEILRNLLRKVVSKMPSSSSYFSLDFKLKRALFNFDTDSYSQHFRWFSPFASRELKELINGFSDDYLAYDKNWPSARQSNVLRQSANLYQKYYLPDDIFTKVDRASMAVSLEARSPFADYRLIELVNRLPDNFKLRNGETKFILKELGRKYLPAEIVDRPKHGFPAPVADWLKGPLKERANELFSPASINRLSLLDYKTVQSYWQDFIGGNNYRARQLWTLFIWQLWSEKK